ncbi:hypothetical protein NHG24_07895 [Aerococcaceae bacterium NML210727]|nr:hypothetical protein [Aerococcaceae bacterium NML210727]MCW6655053.1 hypothetical protein [Aerococcaceae bacterium NML201296]
MTDKICFVVSSIGAFGSTTRKHADDVLEHLINPVCDELGFKVIRVDQESASGNINASIINHLKNDPLVIADMTGHNPNAFYELGFREALGLPLVPIIQKDENLPFDVSSNRTLLYSMHVAEIEKSKEELRNMIQSYSNFNPYNQSEETELNLADIDTKLDKFINELNLSNIDTKLDEILDKLKQDTTINTSLFQNTYTPMIDESWMKKFQTRNQINLDSSSIASRLSSPEDK